MTTCNPDYNIAQIGTQTQWTPVKNLTFTGDLTYTHLDQKYAGVVPNSGAAVGKPAALYELKDQNTLTMMLKVQRNW